VVLHFFLGIVAYKIFQHIRVQQRMFLGELKVRFSANIRIGFLSLYSLFVLVWLLALRLWVEKITNPGLAILTAWMVCRLETSWGFPNAGYCPDPELPQVGIPFSVQMMNSVVLSSVGIVFFAIFGSDGTVYKAWRVYWHHVKTGSVTSFWARAKLFTLNSVSTNESTRSGTDANNTNNSA